VTSSHPGNAEMWSRPTNSLMTNFMSRIGAAYVDIVVTPKKLKIPTANTQRRTKAKPVVQKRQDQLSNQENSCSVYPAIGSCPDSLGIPWVFAVKMLLSQAAR
jgi:hypothetical protein